MLLKLWNILVLVEETHHVIPSLLSSNTPSAHFGHFCPTISKTLVTSVLMQALHCLAASESSEKVA
jgi:hypothetical protein